MFHTSWLQLRLKAKILIDIISAIEKDFDLKVKFIHGVIYIIYNLAIVVHDVSIQLKFDMF